MPTTTTRRCRHCRRPKGYLRPRRLCAACYRDPNVRRRYAPRINQNSGRRRPDGAPDLCGRRPPPAEPTRSLPGSEQRIRELMRRAARQEDLHHPGDRRDDLARGLVQGTDGKRHERRQLPRPVPRRRRRVYS